MKLVITITRTDSDDWVETIRNATGTEFEKKDLDSNFKYVMTDFKEGQFVGTTSIRIIKDEPIIPDHQKGCFG